MTNDIQNISEIKKDELIEELKSVYEHLDIALNHIASAKAKKIQYKGNKKELESVYTLIQEIDTSDIKDKQKKVKNLLVNIDDYTNHKTFIKIHLKEILKEKMLV